MAWLDDYLKDNPSDDDLPQEEDQTEGWSTDFSRIIIGDGIPDQQTEKVWEPEGETDMTRIITGAGEDVTKLEWDVERELLRREINGWVALENYSPQEMEFLEGLMNWNVEWIESTISSIESEIDAAAKYSQDKLVVELWRLTLTGELASTGSEITQEVERVLWIPDWDEISLPTGSDGAVIIFESKREALLYLYYQKFSLKKAQELVDSIDTSEMSEDERRNLWPILKWAFYAIVLTSTVGKVFRKVNHFALRTTAWRLGSGTYISVASQGSEWSEAVGTGEVQKRQEAALLLDYVFDGNNRVSSRSLPDMNVLDHSISVNGENIGGRLWEGTFWRKLRYSSRARGTFSLWRMWDFFLKPILLNTEGGTITRLQNAANIKNAILRSLFQVQETQVGGQIQFIRVEVAPWAAESQMLQNFRAFIDLSHETSNEDEAAIRDRLKAFLAKLEKGELDFVYNMKTPEAAIREVQHRMIEVATWERGSKWDIKRIFGDGTNSNPWEWVQLLNMEVRQTLITMDNYNQVITARKIRAQIDGEPYNERQVRVELQEFFDSVWSGSSQHRYNFKTATLIIKAILDGNTKDDAIEKVSTISWDDVDRTITDRRYIQTENTGFIISLETDLETRAKAIGSMEELENYKRNVLNSLLQDDGSPKTGYGELLRNLSAIIVSKEGEWLPDTRPAPVAAPADSSWSPAEAPDSTNESLRAQPLFDTDGKLTDDARMILEWNLNLYVLNGWELEAWSIEAATAEYLWKITTIGEMIDDLKWLNHINTLETLEAADQTNNQVVRYQAQDIVERWLLISENFWPEVEVRINIDPGNNKLSVNILRSGSIENTIPDITSFDELETKVVSELGITWNIPWWDAINADPDLEFTRWRITDGRQEKLSFLRYIDDFFRKAR